ncbi:MAG TPA: hypothetical protein VFG51_01235, partial [Candidatus Saccharimonadia bacterium]|nr:hypothetical protein [Candidatus Saccharimonadia bacterium]
LWPETERQLQKLKNNTMKNKITPTPPSDQPHKRQESAQIVYGDGWSRIMTSLDGLAANLLADLDNCITTFYPDYGLEWDKKEALAVIRSCHCGARNYYNESQREPDQHIEAIEWHEQLESREQESE